MTTPDLTTLLAGFNPHFSHNWTINRPVQMQMREMWARMWAEGRPPTLRDAGFRAFSQTDEDGILLWLFTALDIAQGTAVELCCGDGIECNVANLVVNHGWRALMVDGDERNVADARLFHETNRDSGRWPPTVAHAWVTAEGVNDLCRANGFHGEVELLSLDLDGVDWWVWRALTDVRPKVVVAEYQAHLGPDAALTVPYDPAFKATWRDRACVHGGASLAALVKLGREKGYRLIGHNALCFNAFFLREDLLPEVFPEIPARACFDHPRAAHHRAVYGPMAETFAWVEV